MDYNFLWNETFLFLALSERKELETNTVQVNQIRIHFPVLQPRVYHFSFSVHEIILFYSWGNQEDVFQQFAPTTANIYFTLFQLFLA